jgi:hypothetical protein
MNDYHKLEDPDVYKARRLAIEIADSTVKNQMILREHSRYKLLREEVERQNIKEKALLQLSQQRNIQPNEKAVFENVLVNANRQPELNGGVSRSSLPSLPTPPPPLSDDEDEPLLAEDDEDELPEMIQLYNQMDDEQLAIVLENFKVDIDNLDKEARNSLIQKGEDLIAQYGSKMNGNVYDLIAELLEYIEEVEEEEAEEEKAEEKAEEEEEEEDKPRETDNLQQIKNYLKKKGYSGWGGLTKQQSIQILRAVGNVSDEQIQEQIKNFNKENQERRKGGQSSKRKRRRSRQEGNGHTQGNGLIQLGTGIAEDLQKLIVMIGSKRSGNDSKALSKKIVALQKKIKKDIERKQKKETKAIEMEKTRQRIKKIAKESM